MIQRYKNKLEFLLKSRKTYFAKLQDVKTSGNYFISSLNYDQRIEKVHKISFSLNVFDLNDF